MSPCSAATPIVVGASTDSDNIASFSNIGRCLTLFAPGAPRWTDHQGLPMLFSTSNMHSQGQALDQSGCKGAVPDNCGGHGCMQATTSQAPRGRVTQTSPLCLAQGAFTLRWSEGGPATTNGWQLHSTPGAGTTHPSVASACGQPACSCQRLTVQARVCKTQPLAMHVWTQLQYGDSTRCWSCSPLSSGARHYYCQGWQLHSNPRGRLQPLCQRPAWPAYSPSRACCEACSSPD